MIKDIKSSFLKLLAENDWMDLKTKETARSKVRLIKFVHSLIKS